MATAITATLTSRIEPELEGRHALAYMEMIDNINHLLGDA